MQGPGTAAPAAGVVDDRSRRSSLDRRATDERNIAAAGTAWRGRDSVGRDAQGRGGAMEIPGRFEGVRRPAVRAPAVLTW